MKLELLYENELAEALACKSLNELRRKCARKRGWLVGWRVSIDHEGDIELYRGDAVFTLIRVNDSKRA